MRSLPLLALLAVAACAPNPNLTLNPVQQPIVTRADYVIDVAVGPAGLPAAERTRLEAWLHALRPAYGDSIAVDDPLARPAVRAAVAGIAGDRGLLLAPAAPVTAGAVAPGAARVVLSRSTATMSGCPDFSHEQSPHQAPETSRNFGCAMTANLAAMIADPQDLLRGRSTALGDAETTVEAAKVWRDREPSGKAALKRVIVQEAATSGGGGK